MSLSIDAEEVGFGDSPTPKFMRGKPTAADKADGSTFTRRQTFERLLAGGSRDGLPAEFLADYDRSARAWGR